MVLVGRGFLEMWLVRLRGVGCCGWLAGLTVL